MTYCSRLIILFACSLSVASCEDAHGSPHVDNNRFTVSVTLDPDNGHTEHSALSIEISYPNRKSLIISTDDKEGIIAPIPTKIVSLDDAHSYLVGTSSPGAGMERWHILSLGISSTHVILLQEIAFTSSRVDPSILLSKKNKRLVGIVVPSITPQNKLDWELDVGKQKFTLDDLLKMSPMTENTNGDTVLPAQSRIPDRVLAIWFNVQNDGKIELKK